MKKITKSHVVTFGRGISQKYDGSKGSSSSSWSNAADRSSIFGNLRDIKAVYDKLCILYVFGAINPRWGVAL